MVAATRRKRNRKWLKWVVFLVLLIVAGVICYLVWDGYFRDKDEGEVDTSTEQVVAKEEKVTKAKQEVTEKVEEVVEKEKVVQYEGEDPNTKEQLTGVITYAGVSGEYLMIRVNIDQYLAGGTCILRLMNGGSEVYSDTAGIVDAAATATCEGFNVPVAELLGGNLGVVIEVSSGEKSGKITGEVSL
ncbi:hypothetical protein IJG90_00585 [Candidatus Saccharibacteria bacterium]|nr:hypothetical protein [Candidatus Saccharibacteria bacterium]